MAILVDTYTVAVDTEVTGHTPDTGTGYSRIHSDGGAPRISAIAATDRLKVSTGGNDSGVVYTCNGTYPSANYEGEITYVAGSAFANRPYYWAIRLADIENMYALRMTNVASGHQLYKKVAGTWTALGSAITIAVGSVIKLSANGTAIKVFDDGIEVISVTDSDLSAAGKFGFAVGGGSELVTSTDDANGSWEFDSLTITDLGGGAQTVTVNQVTETDTAQAISQIKRTALGQSAETDLAQALTRVKRLAIAQVTEANLAQAITALKTKTIAQVFESDIAQVITTLKTLDIGQVSETELAQSITPAKRVSIGQVTETNIAQSIAWSPKHRLVELALETNLAQAISASKVVPAAQVTETDAAQPITGSKVLAVGQVSETDSAQSISAGEEIVVPVGQVSETDIAQSIAKTKLLAVGQISETDISQPISRSKSKVILQVTETDAAQAVSRIKIQIVSQVSETDLAQALFKSKRVSVTQVVEVDLAQVISWLKHRAVAQVSETDAAQAIEKVKLKAIGQVSETDFAQSITEAGVTVIVLGQAVETDTALAVSIGERVIRRARNIFRTQRHVEYMTDDHQVYSTQKRKADEL